MSSNAWKYFSKFKSKRGNCKSVFMFLFNLLASFYCVYKVFISNSFESRLARIHRNMIMFTLFLWWNKMLGLLCVVNINKWHYQGGRKCFLSTILFKWNLTKDKYLYLCSVEKNYKRHGNNVIWPKNYSSSPHAIADNFLLWKFGSC